jgi:alpha-1,3-rhamnosyl/mannosyltransferase
MKRYHIGIDATTWSNDRGFGRFTREFVMALAARDSEFRYTLVFDQPYDGSWPIPDGVEVLSATTERNLNEAAVGDQARSPLYLWQMGQQVSRAEFDLFYYPAVYSYFPLLSRVPKVVCFHDTTAERIPHLLFPKKINHRLWQIKTWLAKKQMTRAMTVSESSARDMVDYLGIQRSKTDVVTEAADPAFHPINDAEVAKAARARYGIPPKAKLFVYVGGMNAHKNILELLKTMPEVVAAHPNAHLAIVGSTSGKGFWDDVPALMNFVSANPALEERVHFTDYIADEDLVELFASTDALVFPSLWEGFGLPAVEAMSCGVPVLASDLSSLPEVIGDAGLYFDPHKRDTIRDTLIRFLDSPDLQDQLRSAALQQAAKFTWDLAAELGEESFRRTLNI